MDPGAAAALQTAQYNLGALQTLGRRPTPERTYDAITLSLNKRFSKNWFARASYTYSRLIGNYEGLYQNETNYIAPNGSNAYDTPDLYVNQNGPLPNDRPHLLQRRRLLHATPSAAASSTFGLSFTARSGMPRNYMGNLMPGTAYQIVSPVAARRRRADADRHPAERQDRLRPPARPQDEPRGRSSTCSTSSTSRRRFMTDDNYTFDAAPPIVNGTPQDLKFAKNADGAPIAQEPELRSAARLPGAVQRAPRPATDVLVLRGTARCRSRPPGPPRFARRSRAALAPVVQRDLDKRRPAALTGGGTG